MCREEIPLEVLKQIIISGCKYLSLFRSILVGDNFRLDQQPSQLKYLDLRLYDSDGICKANYKVIEELLSSCQSLQKLSLAKLTLNFEMIKNLCLQNGSTLQTLGQFFLYLDCHKVSDVNYCHLFVILRGELHIYF